MLFRSQDCSEERFDDKHAFKLKLFSDESFTQDQKVQNISMLEDYSKEFANASLEQNSFMTDTNRGNERMNMLYFKIKKIIKEILSMKNDIASAKLTTTNSILEEFKQKFASSLKNALIDKSKKENTNLPKKELVTMGESDQNSMTVTPKSKDEILPSSFNRISQGVLSELDQAKEKEIIEAIHKVTILDEDIKKKLPKGEKENAELAQEIGRAHV